METGNNLSSGLHGAKGMGVLLEKLIGAIGTLLADFDPTKVRRVGAR